jgi:hypothetical protein
MKYSIIESKKGNIAEATFSKDEAITDYRSFFDVIMESPSDTTSISKEKIPEAFFQLKSGLAGDILQKVSNYRKRLLIMGDFSELGSNSLKDFIYESNNTGKVIFSNTIENAIELLK